MNYSLLLSILTCSIIASTVSSQAVQYIKEHLLIKNVFIYAVVSFIVGFFFAVNFGKFGWQLSLWGGLLTVIGAETLYKTLKGSFGLDSQTILKNSNSINQNKEN